MQKRTNLRVLIMLDLASLHCYTVTPPEYPKVDSSALKLTSTFQSTLTTDLKRPPATTTSFPAQSCPRRTVPSPIASTPSPPSPPTWTPCPAPPTPDPGPVLRAWPRRRVSAPRWTWRRRSRRSWTAPTSRSAQGRSFKKHLLIAFTKKICRDEKKLSTYTPSIF